MAKKPVEVFMESDGTWMGTHIYNAVTRMEYADIVALKLNFSPEHDTDGYMLRDAGSEASPILVKEFIVIKEDDDEVDIEFSNGGM